MSKKTPKKVTEKKSFDLKSFKKSKGIDMTVKEKDITWIPLSDSFHEALKIPGLARGYFTSFRGYSNTGKSTAIYEAVAGAQKIGDLPIIIDTEGSFNWEHAKMIGMQYEVEYHTMEVEDVNPNSGEITINKTGIFLITANVSTYVSSSTTIRSDSYAVIDKNSSQITGTAMWMYNREGPDSEQGHNTGSASLILDITSGDVIRVQAARFSGTDTVGIRLRGSRLTFLEL